MLHIASARGLYAMAITDMQRRKSGIYEFRKRLPQDLAGKPAPEHVKAAFPSLVNTQTGCFKRELVKSLGTNDTSLARKADVREAHAALEMFEEAQRLVAAKSGITPAPALEFTSAEIELAAHAEILSSDDGLRSGLDPRVFEQTREERATRPHTDQVHENDPDEGLSSANRFAPSLLPRPECDHITTAVQHP